MTRFPKLYNQKCRKFWKHHRLRTIQGGKKRKKEQIRTETSERVSHNQRLYKPRSGDTYSQSNIKKSCVSLSNFPALHIRPGWCTNASYAMHKEYGLPNNKWQLQQVLYFDQNHFYDCGHESSIKIYLLLVHTI